MFENVMLSMTHALNCIKNEAQPSTQKEQHYFPLFSAVSLPEEDLCGSAKVTAFVMFGEILILHPVRYFLSRVVNKEMFGGIGSA